MPIKASRDPQARTLTTYRAAYTARQAGISVVPISPDGRKCPSFPWKRYQQYRATASELTGWFARSNNGLALVMGTVSGGLETLDFDTREIYQLWRESMHKRGWGALHDRLAAGYLEASPGGIHLLYRCQEIEGSQKLAAIPAEEPQHLQTLIETRGEGGLVIVAPSCGGVHPSGKPYVLLHGSPLTIQTITARERQALFEVARTFDQTPPTEAYVPKHAAPHLPGAELRPGDSYNQSMTWEELLIPHGWKLLSRRSGQGYWKRPGKKGPGVSATTNYAGSDLLYIFSTSTLFDQGRGYSKFAAYTLLEQGGDFTAAARELAKLGYGESSSSGV